MLPLNFHKTFIPERRLIAALLMYAALGKSGTFQEIAAETDIPMGRSTGKVPAIIDYAQGMGLIKLLPTKPSSIKRPVLTAFGRVVYSQDRFLGEPMTQWIAHMNLCRSDIGARTWHQVFARGTSSLGTSFSKQQLEEYLVSTCGPGNDRTGPLVSTYTDDAALGRAQVFTVTGDMVTRQRAPILGPYGIAYSSHLLALMEAFFPGQAQVTLSDLKQETYWFDICHWDQYDIERLFSMLELKGFISVDRQMHPWIVERRARAKDVWPHIFDDLA